MHSWSLRYGSTIGKGCFTLFRLDRRGAWARAQVSTQNLLWGTTHTHKKSGYPRWIWLHSNCNALGHFLLVRPVIWWPSVNIIPCGFQSHVMIMRVLHYARNDYWINIDFEFCFLPARILHSDSGHKSNTIIITHWFNPVDCFPTE